MDKVREINSKQSGSVRKETESQKEVKILEWKGPVTEMKSSVD